MNEIKKLERIVLRQAGQLQALANLLLVIAGSHPEPKKILADFEALTKSTAGQSLELDYQEGLDSIHRELKQTLLKLHGSDLLSNLSPTRGH